MKLINKIEFTIVALDKNTKTFVVYVATLSVLAIQLYPSQIRLLSTDKVFLKVLLEYLNYADIFLLDLAMKLFRYTGINEYTIKLIKDK